MKRRVNERTPKVRNLGVTDVVGYSGLLVHGRFGDANESVWQSFVFVFKTVAIFYKIMGQVEIMN